MQVLLAMAAPAVGSIKGLNLVSTDNGEKVGKLSAVRKVNDLDGI